MVFESENGGKAKENSRHRGVEACVRYVFVYVTHIEHLLRQYHPRGYYVPHRESGHGHHAVMNAKGSDELVCGCGGTTLTPRASSLWNHKGDRY